VTKKKKFDTGLIGRIADKGKKLNVEKQIDNTDNKTNTDINVSNEIDNNSNTKTDNDNKFNPSTSTNIDTNTKKKKKYPKKQEMEKIQRAYYFEYELLKEFESFCKRNKADKSEVISFALREFLNTYE